VGCTIVSNAIRSGLSNPVPGPPGQSGPGREADSEGGGLRVLSGTNRIAGNIVWANQAVRGGPDQHGPFQSAGYNLLGSTTGAAGLDPTDRAGLNPRLGSFGRHGGWSPSYELMPTSPARDAWLSSVEAASDQRGAPRPAGAQADIGAHEFYDVSVAGRAPHGGLRLRFLTSQAGGQEIQASSDLHEWRAVATVPSSLDGVFEFEDAFSASNRVYRLLVRP